MLYVNSQKCFYDEYEWGIKDIKFPTVFYITAYIIIEALITHPSLLTTIELFFNRLF